MTNPFKDPSALRSVVLWVIGMLLCPLGVALCAVGGFGVSMIEAPVYVLYLKLSQLLPWFTFGMAEYLLQAIVLLLLALLTRFWRWSWLLSFGTAVLYGLILDFWRLFTGTEVYDALWLRIVCTAAGLLLNTFSVACYFRTFMPLEVWELFVKTYSERKGRSITKVKWIYDVSSLSLGILMMLLFFGRIDFTAIGVGTVAATITNAPVIAFFGRCIDRLWPPKAPAQ